MIKILEKIEKKLYSPKKYNIKGKRVIVMEKDTIKGVNIIRSILGNFWKKIDSVNKGERTKILNTAKYDI